MNGISGMRLYGLLGIGTVIAGTLSAACSGDEAPSPAPTTTSPSAPSDPSSPATPTPTASGEDTPAPPPVKRPPIELAPAGDGDQPLAPETLGNRLVLWLSADTGVEGPANALTGWKDQSKQKNDAVALGGVVTSTTNAINGHPTVHFDGGTGFMDVANSASLQFGTGDVTAYAVLAHASPLAASSRLLFSKQDAPYPYTGFGMYVNFANTYGVGAILQFAGPTAKVDSDTQDPYATSKPMLVWSQRSGADSLTFDIGAKHVESSSLFNGQTVDLSNTAHLRIGGQGNLSQTLTGDVAELILVKGSMTSAETKSVADYLTKKYGL